jgi:NDP-sugar pyrophosphorylase family protein
MKAMIFAAGLGTRLKPITDTLPKALVPIAGKTLLEHTILKLKSSGFTDIVINVHHFAGQIIDFLKANNNFGVNISISDESEMLLETGGGIRKAAPLLGSEPFLIHNVDIVSNIDLRHLYNEHIKTGADATLLVSKRESSRALLFDNDGNLKAWRNNSTGEVKTPFESLYINSLQPYAFSGIHVFSPSLFPQMSGYPDKFPIMDFYLDICKKAKIKALVCNDLRLIDVGKLNSLSEAEKLVTELNA